MSMEQRRPSDVSQEFSLSQERDVLTDIMTFIGEEVGITYHKCPLTAFRGMLRYNENDEPTHFTLAIDQNSSLSEETYTAVLVYSSILLGNALDISDKETIILPQPIEGLIAPMNQDFKQKQLATLVMAESLFFQEPPEEWGEDLKEAMQKRPKIWQDQAKSKAETLYPHFNNPIFQQSLLPRFQSYLADDGLAITEF